MRTSQKVLITSVAIVTAVLLTSMVVIRNHIQAVFTKTSIESQYKPVVVEKFDKLDLSANWVVVVKQGGAYKIELAVDDTLRLKPIIKNINGTLFLSVDTIQYSKNTGSIKARITTPSLKAIKSVSGTRVHLKDFHEDSLAIDIQDGCVFTGTDNKFKRLSFNSSGNARIELTQTAGF